MSIRRGMVSGGRGAQEGKRFKEIQRALLNYFYFGEF